MTADDVVMELLAEHIPLTLLLDLFAPPDPRSLYADEGGDADWLDCFRAGVA